MNLLRTFCLLLPAVVLIGCHHPTQVAPGLEQTQALRGTGDSGGGKGILCNNELLLLDLFEARAKGLIEAPRQNSFDDELSVAVRRELDIDNYPGQPATKTDSVQRMKKDFYSRTRFVSSRGSLQLTEDATLPDIPRGCRVVQIAIWHDDHDSIQIDSSYWSQLDERNQAALVLHEYLYKERRVSVSAKNSDEARAYVAKLFSTTPPLAHFPEVPTTGHLECIGNGLDQRRTMAKFFVYPFIKDGVRGSAFNFLILAESHVLWRTTAFVPTPDLESILNSHRVDPISLQFEVSDEYSGGSAKVRIDRGVKDSTARIKISPSNGSPDHEGSLTCSDDDFSKWTWHDDGSRSRQAVPLEVPEEPEEDPGTGYHGGEVAYAMPLEKTDFMLNGKPAELSRFSKIDLPGLAENINRLAAITKIIETKEGFVELYQSDELIAVISLSGNPQVVWSSSLIAPSQITYSRNSLPSEKAESVLSFHFEIHLASDEKVTSASVIFHGREGASRTR